MEPVTIIRSRTVVIPTANIDTDQIIPARFLTTTTREGLGARLFADWRYDAAGHPKADFALNGPETSGCQVLVTGRNFGCGSSREHAPWALIDYGIRAVISTGIADIFRANALKNGLLPVLVDERIGAWLVANPGAEVTIDLERTVLELPNGAVAHFPMDAFSRYCLLNGLDELEYLLGHAAAIEAHEQRLQASPT